MATWLDAIAIGYIALLAVASVSVAHCSHRRHCDCPRRSHRRRSPFGLPLWPSHVRPVFFFVSLCASSTTDSRRRQGNRRLYQSTLHSTDRRLETR